MSLIAEFPGYRFQIYPLTWKKTGDIVDVDGEAIYAISANARDQFAAFCDKWDRTFSYVIGLYLDAAQTIEVSYFSRYPDNPFKLVQDNHFTAELNEHLGHTTDKAWIALVPPANTTRTFKTNFATNASASFDVRVKLWPVTAPQFIPFVARYRFDGSGNLGSFKNNFISSLWWIPSDVSRKIITMEGARQKTVLQISASERGTMDV